MGATTVSLWTDGAAAIAARDEGMSRVEVRSAPWRVVAWDALIAVARRTVVLSSEDVWRELDRMGVSRPIEPRAIGPVMMRAVREGVLTPLGYERGTDPKHHRDILRVYRSTVSR